MIKIDHDTGDALGRVTGDLSGRLSQQFTITGSGKMLAEGVTITNPIAAGVGAGVEAFGNTMELLTQRLTEMLHEE